MTDRQTNDVTVRWPKLVTETCDFLSTDYKFVIIET